MALNLGLTVYIVVGANLEERRLVGEFCSAYGEYKKGTPMLVPSSAVGNQMKAFEELFAIF